MNIRNISVPEVYDESHDFRFFIAWIAFCLSKLQYDTENLLDLYDALRCPANLLWMLADTMGFKFDDRLPVAYNRLVLLYFMSMIRNRGSKDGVTLAAETNLAQFHVLDSGKVDDIFYNRLEDTSIPVNSAYVTPHTPEGYIEVVYFSDKLPVDACIEYVRPLGMYLFQYVGVRYDARTKIGVDARLASNYTPGKVPATLSIGATHIGHYRRDDYARMQKTYMAIPQNYPSWIPEHEIEMNDTSDIRHKVWYRNSEYEDAPSDWINPGYRALSSLQMCNSDTVFHSLLHDPIFSIGYEPQDVSVIGHTDENSPYNLRYDLTNDETSVGYNAVRTLNEDKPQSETRPIPMVNPVMAAIGDAMTMPGGSAHTKVTVDPDTREVTGIGVESDTPV